MCVYFTKKIMQTLLTYYDKNILRCKNSEKRENKNVHTRLFQHEMLKIV